MTIENLTFDVRANSTDESIINNVVGTDEYDAKVLIKPGDVVVDIGGHIGSFSVLACSLGAEVYTYEPLLQSFELLDKNLSQNGFNSKRYNKAVMSERGIRQLAIRNKNFGGSNFYQISSDMQDCECITLDDVFADNSLTKIDFLKLDCEGSEYEIIRDSDKLPVIKTIAFEYVGDERRNEMLTLLSDYEIIKDKHNDVFGTVVVTRK